MEFIKKNIRWIGLGGILLSLVALFLPLAEVSAEVFGISIGESIKYIDGDGKIVLVVLLISGILLFLKKDLFSLISLIISVIICVYNAINVGDAFSDVDSLYGNLIDVNFGIGFYLLFIGLVVAGCSIVYSIILSKTNIGNGQLNNSIN